MNLTSRNQDPIHASLALSSLLSIWHKPNSLNNKSIYNTLLLEFYICAKPRLTHWYPCPKKKCHYFCTGVYMFLRLRYMSLCALYWVSAPITSNRFLLLRNFVHNAHLLCVQKLCRFMEVARSDIFRGLFGYDKSNTTVRSMFVENLSITINPRDATCCKKSFITAHAC